MSLKWKVHEARGQLDVSWHDIFRPWTGHPLGEARKSDKKDHVATGISGEGMQLIQHHGCQMTALTPRVLWLRGGAH